MKTKNILGLIVLGAIAWYFLKRRKVNLGQAQAGQTSYPFPAPGIYFARLTPLETAVPGVSITPTVPTTEVPVTPQVPKSTADIMESIVEASKRNL
jgi:hypothetical protein